MRKFLMSFTYALKGMQSAMRDQQNLRIHIGIGMLTVAGALYFEITSLEWCVILLTIAVVIGLEMVNSAIENLTDLVTREQHPLAGKVKDIAAGAVLFASFLATIIGIIVFYKYVFD